MMDSTGRLNFVKALRCSHSYFGEWPHFSLGEWPHFWGSGRIFRVMARLVRATYSGTCACIGGPDNKPIHDGGGDVNSPK
jgi:hypothetical protein